ncbi:MAG: cbb3-type cytochrome c oxidase subunit I [Candidatus Lambdaproteobacteria bacterium]|nr:cbb3-type cytochrome c oxidase subunit I [Candidatus Lambdaproteobacteria bacterium]
MKATAAKNWLGLALGALLLGGLLSLFLVSGRAPYLSRVFDDPQFVKRILVIHVNLTLEVWILGFFGALFLSLPGARAGSKTLLLAGLGVVLFVASGFLPGAEPILSNYIPVLNHPLFFTGIALFYASVALTLLDRRLLPVRQSPERSALPLPREAQLLLKTAGAIYLLGLVVFALAIAHTSREMAAPIYFEFIFWGGGHVFQFVNIAAMLAVWVILLDEVMGAPVPGQPVAWLICAMLLLPALAAVALTAGGTQGAAYYPGFMLLMRWATWPAIALLLIVAGRALFGAIGSGRLAPRRLYSAAFGGFFWSAVLILLGFALGALIGQSTTLIPAHYHATIGSVTVAFMAATYLLLERLGLAIPTPRLKRLAAWQPTIYGGGQLAFALGFAGAGLHGLERKAYGPEQAIRSVEQTIGLGVMGIGGMFAIAGGGLFLYIAARTYFQRAWTMPPAPPKSVNAHAAPGTTEPR